MLRAVQQLTNGPITYLFVNARLFFFIVNRLKNRLINPLILCTDVWGEGLPLWPYLGGTIYLLNQAGTYAVRLCRQIRCIFRCRCVSLIFQEHFVLNLMISLVHMPTPCFGQLVKHCVTCRTYKPSFLAHLFTLNCECARCLISVFYHVNCIKVFSLPFRASEKLCTFLAVLFAYTSGGIVL